MHAGTCITAPSPVYLNAPDNGGASAAANAAKAGLRSGRGGLLESEVRVPPPPLVGASAVQHLLLSANDRAFSRYPGAHDPQRKTDGDGGRGARGTQAADRDERSEQRRLQVFATESIERLRCAARRQRRIKLELGRCGR